MWYRRQPQTLKIVALFGLWPWYIWKASLCQVQWRINFELIYLILWFQDGNNWRSHSLRCNRYHILHVKWTFLQADETDALDSEVLDQRHWVKPALACCLDFWSCLVFTLFSVLDIWITYGPHKAVAEVSNHNELIGRKSGIQLVRKSMDFTFNCVLFWTD